MFSLLTLLLVIPPIPKLMWKMLQMSIKANKYVICIQIFEFFLLWFTWVIWTQIFNAIYMFSCIISFLCYVSLQFFMAANLQWFWRLLLLNWYMSIDFSPFLHHIHHLTFSTLHYDLLYISYWRFSWLIYWYQYRNVGPWYLPLVRDIK